MKSFKEFTNATPKNIGLPDEFFYMPVHHVGSNGENLLHDGVNEGIYEELDEGAGLDALHKIGVAGQSQNAASRVGQETTTSSNLYHEPRPAGSNPWKKVREGDAAAFPENESESDRKRKHKEAVAAWQQHKRDYENKINSQREEENKSIDAKNAEIRKSNETLPKKSKQKELKRKKVLSLGDGKTLTSSNGKYDPSHHTGKSTEKSVYITGLALAPHTIAGKETHGTNLCPKATGGCKRTCLALKAGMNRGEERNYHLKVARTSFLMNHPEHAIRMIDHEHSNDNKWCRKQTDENGKPKPFEHHSRLNANSDISFENVTPNLLKSIHKRVTGA